MLFLTKYPTDSVLDVVYTNFVCVKKIIFEVMKLLEEKAKVGLPCVLYIFCNPVICSAVTICCVPEYRRDDGIVSVVLR